ncbi:S-adenosylmethionine decarboxylase [Hydrogenophaga sp. 5NK40-0174]|uniref:S-adenosylmethionine decarboxylase family protein n=1 Tax=Hydrogenophaga sp. 5NK40-0174 TaxID=3127649 RepID=UPI003109F134
MDGLHLLADLRSCACEEERMTNADRLLAACDRLVRANGLTPVAQVAHSFPGTEAGPGGVTATILLAESHLSVHTWPESGSVSLDVYVCNFSSDNSKRAQALLDALLDWFEPDTVSRQRITRGRLPVR